MGNLEEYAKSERAFQNAKKLKTEHPKGWEPGLDTAKKEIISKPQKKAQNPHSPIKFTIKNTRVVKNDWVDDRQLI